MLLYKTRLYNRTLAYRSWTRLKSLLKHHLYNFNIAFNPRFNNIEWVLRRSWYNKKESRFKALKRLN
jgi:hypothetical protein